MWHLMIAKKTKLHFFPTIPLPRDNPSYQLE